MNEQKQREEVERILDHMEEQMEPRDFTPSEAEAFKKFLNNSKPSGIRGRKLPVWDSPAEQERG